MNQFRRASSALLLMFALLAAGCSGSDESSSKSSTTEKSGSSSNCDDSEEVSEGLAAVEERGKPEPTSVDPVPSELEVTDEIEGDGAEVIPTGSVEVHYVLSSVDGTELQSTWETAPQKIAFESAFPEFAEVMDKMLVGGRRVAVVPGEVVYGDQTPDGVTAGDPVVFTIDLVGVSEESATQENSTATADPDALAAAEKRGEPEVTVPEGEITELEVIDDVEGDGAEVCAGDTVVAHYVGVTAEDGEVFESSWTAEPSTFPLDGVIQGWSEGLVGMNVGGRRTLVIPAEMAYGEDTGETTEGPPSGDLVFTIDMVGVG